MISYISDEFHLDERHYYWRQCNESNTFCRIAAVVHYKECTYEELGEKDSEPCDGQHAEIIALENIVDELESQYWMLKDDSTVVDVIIRINNSPSSDCQDELDDLLMRIKAMVPRSHFRLILFFSNLYDKSDEGIEDFSEWILDLVDKGVVVFVCPLFVTKMVPMPPKISKTDKREVADGDQENIDCFRDLLSEIEDCEGSFSIRISHELFRRSRCVRESLFSWENPHFIAILPRNVPEALSEIIMEPKFFKSEPTKKLQDRTTRKKPHSNTLSQDSKPAKRKSKRFPAKDYSASSSKRVKYSN